MPLYYLLLLCVIAIVWYPIWELVMCISNNEICRTYQKKSGQRNDGVKIWYNDDSNESYDNDDQINDEHCPDSGNYDGGEGTLLYTAIPIMCDDGKIIIASYLKNIDSIYCGIDSDVSVCVYYSCYVFCILIMR